MRIKPEKPTDFKRALEYKYGIGNVVSINYMCKKLSSKYWSLHSFFIHEQLVLEVSTH